MLIDVDNGNERKIQLIIIKHTASNKNNLTEKKREFFYYIMKFSYSSEFNASP